MHDQLGWSEEDCQERTQIEMDRKTPKTILTDLENRGWILSGKRVLDLGAGQGGLLLELLSHGADAVGIEPGDEFSRLAQIRLADSGQDPSRVIQALGESLPFSDAYFDYVISLQVLEHVPAPLRILQEVYRVLKPGGACYITCENYLSFFEPHYRVRWLPLLPKPIGAWYLRKIGRDPRFLLRYVYYTTYLQIWRLCSTVGFCNITYGQFSQKLDHPETIHRPSVRALTTILSMLPLEIGRFLLNASLHVAHVFKPSLTVVLSKPRR